VRELPLTLLHLHCLSPSSSYNSSFRCYHWHLKACTNYLPLVFVYRRYTSSAHDSAFTIAAFFEAGFARAAAFGGMKAAVRGLMLFVNIFSYFQRLRREQLMVTRLFVAFFGVAFMIVSLLLHCELFIFLQRRACFMVDE
jgi:hypothetical protein